MRRIRTRSLGSFTLVLVVLAAAPLACERGGDDEDEAPASAPSRVEATDAGVVVALDEATRRRLGVRLELPKPATLPARVAAPGEVLVLDDLVDAQSRILVAGAHARAARADLGFARAAWARTRRLYRQAQNASAEALQEARRRLDAARAALDVARSEQAAARRAARQRFGPVLAGWLEEEKSPLGDLLSGRTVLVRASLPAATAAAPSGAAADVELPDGRVLAGHLVSEAPRVEPRFQGRAFLYRVPGARGVPAGTSVTVHVPVGPPRQGVVLPRSAVVFDQGRAFVWVLRPEGLVRRGVSTEAPVPGGFFVSTGLARDARIVVQGAQLLLSESRRGEARVED